MALHRLSEPVVDAARQRHVGRGFNHFQTPGLCGLSLRGSDEDRQARSD
jgi:hypothetical protein